MSTQRRRNVVESQAHAGYNLRNENEEKRGTENIREAGAAGDRFIQGLVKYPVRPRAFVYPFPQTPRQLGCFGPFLSSDPA